MDRTGKRLETANFSGRSSVRIVLASLSLLLVVSFSCASYTQETTEIREAYYRENFTEAKKKLDDSSIKPDNRNRLLFHLESAMIYDRQGNFKEAKKHFLAADRVADELYTTSISKTAASFIYNDSATDYAGEDFEVVSIHAMLALMFIEEGDYRSARVSAKKINNKINEINTRYDDNKNSYASDAFAFLLSGLIYEALGEWDDAIIDYRKALDLYSGRYKKFIRGGVPDVLVSSLLYLYSKRGRSADLEKLKKQLPSQTAELAPTIPSNPRDFTKVVIFQELGNITPKKAVEQMLPISDQLIRFSFPAMSDSHHKFTGKSGVQLPGKAMKPSDNAQDFTAIGYATMSEKRARVIAKTSARLLIKAQATQKAKEQMGTLGWLAGTLYSTITETADTRGWTLLPGAINVYSTWVNNAQFPVTLKLFNESRMTIKKLRMKDKNGNILFLRNK